MSSNLDLDSIRALKVLGKGATGTVFLAHDTLSDPSALSPFALKVVPKPPSHHHKSTYTRALWEISLLSSLDVPHPFLPSLSGSFESEELLGWATPYCPGGDLNNLRHKQTDHVFSQSAIKFYLAEIVCALEHLHSVGIAYRDLKPENVLVQSSGHVTLTDFDLSKKLTLTLAGKPPDKLNPTGKLPEKLILAGKLSGVENKPGKVKPKNTHNLKFARIFGCESKVSPGNDPRRKTSFAGGGRSDSFVGTEEYVSPESVRGESHSYGVDWWALGVLAYEMLYGTTPFRGKNRRETYRNVLTKRVEFTGRWTALMDLIGRLLEKDPAKRLGYYRGAEEIKEHEFFKGMRWDLLTEIVRPPFVPSGYEGTEKLTPFDVREYFQKGRAVPSIPSSSMNSSSDDDDDDLF